MNKDLTVGKPETVLWKFCMPLFGSIIFQQLYNIADSFVAGKFIGENALAAVGESYGITMIFIAFAFGCNIGCSVIVSQLFGAKDYNRMKTAVYTTLIASAMLCIFLMLVGILSCSWLLHITNTPEEIFEDSKLYLDIYIWGFPFLLFYNVATGFFFGIGRFQDTFYFSGNLIYIQCGSGYLVCSSISYGSCGRGMGNLFVSGNKLCAGGGCGI